MHDTCIQTNTTTYTNAHIHTNLYANKQTNTSAQSHTQLVYSLSFSGYETWPHLIKRSITVLSAHVRSLTHRDKRKGLEISSVSLVRFCKSL